MTDSGVRRVLKDLRHHFVVLNGNFATRDAALIESLQSEIVEVSYTMYDADYEFEIDRVLDAAAPGERELLERAQRLFAELRGMTFLEAFVIEKQPWFAGVATELNYDEFVAAIDAVLTSA